MKTYKITLHREELHEEAPDTPLVNPTVTARYLRDNVFDPAEGYRESCHLLFLDKKNRLIGRYNLSVGGTDATTMDVKLACKAAIETLACGVILSHNHPSGDPLPGRMDIQNTDRLKKALAVFNISLVDHIILGEKTFFSFAEEVTHRYGKATRKTA